MSSRLVGVIFSDFLSTAVLMICTCCYTSHAQISYVYPLNSSCSVAEEAIIRRFGRHSMELPSEEDNR